MLEKQKYKKWIPLPSRHTKYFDRYLSLPEIVCKHASKNNFKNVGICRRYLFLNSVKGVLPYFIFNNVYFGTQ